MEETHDAMGLVGPTQGGRGCFFFFFFRVANDQWFGRIRLFLVDNFVQRSYRESFSVRILLQPIIPTYFIRALSRAYFSIHWSSKLSLDLSAWLRRAVLTGWVESDQFSFKKIIDSSTYGYIGDKCLALRCKELRIERRFQGTFPLQTFIQLATRLKTSRDGISKSSWDE